VEKKLQLIQSIVIAVVKSFPKGGEIMYCQKCGQYNFDYSIYCYNDGMRLLNNSIEMNMSKNKSNYCMSCGQKVETYSNYCQNCGQPMFQVNKKVHLWNHHKCKTN
jgi:predicted RNA-binding Zn-ribbon protein involved in translation (DUF1610 family)